MSAHAAERERFQALMESEGMPREISRRILRHAQTVQRLAELACSSEAADRDRVLCNTALRLSVGRCLCADYGSYDRTVERCGAPEAAHGSVPRYMVQSAQAERLIREWCDKATTARTYKCDPVGFTPIFQGDPRGACVTIKVPSGKTNDWGQTGICVPTR